MLKIRFSLLCFLVSATVFAQTPSFTANDAIPDFSGLFEIGAHLGVANGWEDANLANIALGNEALNITGIGLNTLRLEIPESLCEQEGYDVKKPSFQHFSALGAKHILINLGGPSPAHTDQTTYCQGVPNLSFKNLYAPIWDGGNNGTPVNDTNYFARYCYLLVNQYGDQANIWEVLYEPDLDLTGNGWLAPGIQGNWWDQNPSPCDIQFGAPVSHYIRMLRIAYEVIKSVNPNQMIAVGGIRHPSFLNALLHTTDNPDDGSVGADFPYTGGAYFDVLGFQNYPNQDSTIRYRDAGVLVQKRHSDAAVGGLLAIRQSFEDVLAQNGYNGQQYPVKHFINAGTNIPRKKFFDSALFGAEAQKNYVMKAAVASMKAGLKQIQFYALAEALPLPDATKEKESMGFFEAITAMPHEANLTDAGLGIQTMQHFMKGYAFDEELTSQMNLPPQMDGGAFTQPNEKPLFVIWAKTWRDSSEAGEYIYEFPPGFEIKELLCYEWDYNHTGIIQVLLPDYVHTPSSPIFLIPEYLSSTREIAGADFSLTPNPAEEFVAVSFERPGISPGKIFLFDGMGRVVREEPVSPGQTQVRMMLAGLSPGIYHIQWKRNSNISTKKLMIK